MNEQGINATEMLLYATNSCKYATERENVSRIRGRDDEQRNTRRWKRRAQDTIDSPGQRRALNSRYGTHSTQQRNTQGKNKYFNKNERFICIIEKKCVTLQKISRGYLLYL